MQPPSIWYQWPHIPPPAHHHPGTSSHRVITLQGVEALEPPRHHHRAIRMQHHTPMSDHHTKQPPSLAPVPHIPTSTHRHTELPPCKGVKRDAAALDNSLAPVTHIPTSTHHPTELPPCKVWKLTRCSRPQSGTSGHTYRPRHITPPSYHRGRPLA